MKKLWGLMLVLLLTLVFAVSCDSTPATTDSGEDSANTTESQEETTMESTTEATTTPEITIEPETPKVYPLEGKTIIFLGSSVTYGSAAGGYSFADALKAKYKINMIKEAVSGTTLVDNDGGSYVSRMKNNLDTSIQVDHVVVQLSTNDASQNKPLGRLSNSKDPASFNTKTIIGAIEYIVWYCQENWNCPVSFYTGTKYDSSLYEKMVKSLYDVQEKWGIGIIDLWNDADMNAVTEAEYNRYMSDPIHPNKMGYVKWWLPKFVEHLQKYE